MIILAQRCISKQKFLGKVNGIVIEVSPKFELHRNRIDNILPFSATRAFFKSGTQSGRVLPAKTLKCWTMVLQRFDLRCKVAKRSSKHHNKGDVYKENATMDAKSFELVLHAIGKAIRAKYKQLGFPKVRVKLEIDSAGGHGMARGTEVVKKLKKMMDVNYNLELVQQPPNSPFWNILDLTIWQASQLEVDKMNGKARHRESELVEVCKKAWVAVPDVKILQAFEMRKDAAAEVLENDGWCNQEGHGRHGAKRVHVDASYAPLRARLGIL